MNLDKMDQVSLETKEPAPKLQKRTLQRKAKYHIAVSHEESSVSSSKHTLVHSCGMIASPSPTKMAATSLFCIHGQLHMVPCIVDEPSEVPDGSQRLRLGVVGRISSPASQF